MKAETFAVFELAECSREEKRGTAALILTAMQLAEKARREGLLSLEEDIDSLPTPFVRDLFRMVLDGTEAVSIEKAGWIQIYASRIRGIELLNALVALEATLGIQMGEPPFVLVKTLKAYLGADRDLFDEAAKAAASKYVESDEEEEEPAGRFGFGAGVDAVLERAAKRMRLENREVQLLRSSKTMQQLLDGLPPSLLAVVLTHLDYDQRSSWFGRLSAGRQAAVLKELDALPELDPEQFIREAQEALKSMERSLEEKSWPAAGFPLVAELFRGIHGTAAAQVVALLGESAPDLAQRLNRNRFTFKNFIDLNDRSVQKVLREIDSATLALALAGAGAELREKFSRNLSERAWLILSEEIEDSSRFGAAASERAQKSVCEIVLRLIEAGELQNAHGEDFLIGY